MAEQRVKLHGLRGSGPAYYVAGLSRRAVYILDESARLEQVAAELRCFRPGARVLVLPPLDGQPYSATPLHDATRRARLEAFDAIYDDAWDLIVTAARALLEPLPPAGRHVRPRLALEVEQTYDLTELTRDLSRMGYEHRDMVSQPGDFARRGSILDVWSLTHEEPLRLDFFDDELEEIRRFDPSTQRGDQTLTSALVPPHHEWHFDEEAFAHFSKAGGDLWNRHKARDHFLSIVSQIKERGLFPGYSFFAPLAFPRVRYLRDLLDEQAVFFFENTAACEGVLQAYLQQLEASEAEAHASGLVWIPRERLLGGAHPQGLLFPKGRTLLCHHDLAMTNVDQEMGVQSLPNYQNQVHRFVSTWRGHEGTHVIVVVCETEGVHKRLHELLEEDQIVPLETSFPLSSNLRPGWYLARGSLAKGFYWTDKYLVVVGEGDLFAKQARKRRRPKAKRMFLSDFRDLKVGDLVVHQEHGVGRYLGLVEMQAGGLTHEMMALAYKGADKLYVGLDQLDLVQRHSSQSEGAPLDKLGGTTWQKTRSRVKKAVREMAEELIKLYAGRQVVRRAPYPSDTPFQEEFEEAFEHQPTPDQLKATEEIKASLESDRPMDRLLVGDVGFGKTEVAMRMAFKVVMEGGQVAVLCPTTVLAFQHYLSFCNRFAPFPVNIDWISRFARGKQSKQVLEKAAAGELDIVVGTHRLLSKDVHWRELRAVIIDEEQRFGVAHKERLKQMRKKVDVLSMSATPIPRTLNMALSGLRDISVIETAPRNRLAISTSVAPYNETLIKNAISFELERGGQVFFVHNRVETIESQAEELKRLAPRARFLVGHGQMDAKRLESVMLRFMEHEADVLVASTIIENGVDIPNANTMLINRADRFGLSQLYQLRGRIGRSERPAYAYLLAPPGMRLNDNARKRLAAMEEFSDLGAGFRIAAMDLEVRGAGDLLGGRQAGHVNAVGYDMYVRLLEEAVRELKGEKIEDEVHTTLNLKRGAALPKDYIESNNQRLHYYKQLVAAKSDDELSEILAELEDMYGKLPERASKFVDEQRLRLELAALGISGVERDGGELRYRFHDPSSLDVSHVLGLVQSRQGWALTPEGVVRVPAAAEDERLLDGVREGAAILRGKL